MYLCNTLSPVYLCNTLYHSYMRTLVTVSEFRQCGALPARLAIDSDFSWWPGYTQEPTWTGYDALFVSEVDSPPALTLLSQQFRHLERLGQVEIRRGGWPVRTLSFFACRSWRGPAG